MERKHETGGEEQAQNLLMLWIQEGAIPSFLGLCVCKVEVLVSRLCLTPVPSG